MNEALDAKDLHPVRAKILEDYRVRQVAKCEKYINGSKISVAFGNFTKLETEKMRRAHVVVQE